LLGRRRPEYPDADLRELLERAYRLIYALTEQGIEIVTVMHYRQLLPTDADDVKGGSSASRAQPSMRIAAGNRPWHLYVCRHLFPEEGAASGRLNPS